MKTCNVDECNIPQYCKGYCRNHYQKYKKYGDPLYINPRHLHSDICKVVNCESKHCARGFCMKHYRKFKKYGDPLFVHPKFSHPEICSVEGCENKAYERGWCNKHYTRYLRYGDPLHTEKEMEMHGMCGTPEYITWSSMKSRCHNKKDTGYERYGGRGIKVCERWQKSFKTFLKDMGNKPFKGAQIDRILNDGNYEPLNCRWISNIENSRNSSATKLTMENARKIRKLYDTKNISFAELGVKYRVSYDTISSVISCKTWKEQHIFL